MKQINIVSLLTIIMCMVGAKTFAHDIAVANSNGKTIYYTYNPDGTSVSVTYQGTFYDNYSNEYTGDVVIPETVTYGGKTYSVTSISYSAFRNCIGLTSVTIPNSVTSIGDYAFYNTRIKSLTIGTGIQTIASNAFSYSSTNGAANGAYPVKVIWLANTPPSGYKDVGGTINYVPNDSYSGLSNTKIYPFLSSMFEVDGIKYVPVSPSERTCDAIDCIYNESAENTKIGNTVTYKNINMTVQSVGNSICTGNTYIKNLEYTFDGSINSSAFYDCSGLTSVTIGNSVTSIGSDAFRDCSGLTSVTIPNSVTSIGEDAFSGCSGLTSITWNAKYCASSSISSDSPFYDIRTQITEFVISDEVTSIPAYMCYEMSNLKLMTIPNSVTSIGYEAFRGCSGLTSVTIPNSVTSIGDYAFSGCSGLTSVTWNAKNYPAFSSYSSNPFYAIRTQITEFIIGDDVTSIPAFMCDGMSNLKSVSIPNSVTSIGERAFLNCSGLTSVTIPNSVTSIGSLAFQGCSGLEKVIVPNFDIKNWCSITFGSSSANPLYYAHHLYSDENTEITELVIPNSVTSIGSYAFSGCSGLTSVTIPNGVTSIGSSAFSGCSGLKKVIVPDIKNWCSIKFGDSTANPLSFAHHLYSDENTEITKLVIPNDVTSINSYAFYGCSGLTSVTIPNSVTTISSSAFSGCSGLTLVTIPNSVTNIGSSAFSGCSGLTSVTIPNSVTSIGFGAFGGCSGLTSVTIPNSVTSIGSSVFGGCSGLTSVTIPNSVTSIGSSAFSGCSGLTSVTIPNSVTSIPNYVFYLCSGLTSVTIPNSVTSIGEWAFNGCSGLTSVRFENSKDNTPIVLENKVFSDCPLDEVYIGRKLSYTKTSSAGYSPFYRNTTLRSVKFTDKETEISDYEFYGCTNLTDVSMGDGVKSIGAYAFSGCSSLEYFTCGRQLESIGKEAFSDCTSMTKFRTRAAVPPTCGAQALDDINKWECTLYVPMESIDDYQAADQWKNFFFIEKFRVEGDSNGDDTVTMADANAVVNYFLAKGTDGFVEGDFNEEAADVNGDGEITMADANQIVNMFLGGGQ